MTGTTLEGENQNQAGDQAGAPVESGVGEHRSRAAERIQQLIEENKRDREAHRDEMARLTEFFKSSQVRPEPKFDINSIEDPDERREAQLAQTQGEIAALKRQLEADRAALAHERLLQKATHGLDFGDAQGVEDAHEAVGHYARTHSPAETRAYAERMAARFKREAAEPTEPKNIEKKPTPDQEWAKQKLKDREATAPVTRGTISNPPPAPKKPAEAKKSARELMHEARQHLRANFQAQREADQE